MASELQIEGFPIPKFESSSGRFRVTFFKEVITKPQVIKQQLSKRQLLAIEYINEHGSISNTEYQNIANISERTATRELNELKLKNILIQTGGGKKGGRGTVYRIREAE